MAQSLGKLKRFNLQEYWGEEFDKFSAWLIQDEILEMIGDAMNLQLVPYTQNVPGGTLEGSVVVQNMKNNDIVLIQGQLGAISHSHFGKLISSASGAEAVVVIWIASKIPEEQRRNIDWLNDVSRNGISFYGAELELWRIDDSAPAPNFCVVCQPNQWERNSKSDQEEVVSLGSSELNAPPSEKTDLPERKGDWTKKPSEKVLATQQGKSSAHAKEDVAVRENFVYTKSL